MELWWSYDRLISTMEFALLVRWRLYAESGSSILNVLVLKLGPVSISEKTSYRKISWSLEAARFVFRIVRSLWNLTGTSAAVLPMCLSNFKAIRQFKVPISWLRDFTRSYEKTSFRILRRGPESFWWKTRPIQLLLMTWLIGLLLPKLTYHLGDIARSLSSMGKDFNNMCQLSDVK